MKYLLLLLTLLSFNANAGLYLDIGIGWLESLPAEARISSSTSLIDGYENPINIIIEEEAIISVESPFGLLGIGYEVNNWHAELQRFGVLDDLTKSITTFRFYKRIQF